MTQETLSILTEDELDALVSVAIRRAEILEERGISTAAEAWQEVKVYEEKLAALTDPADIAGGIARVGAVRAALAAGERQEAARLAAQYRAEERLPAERREALAAALRDDEQRLAKRFPSLARHGRLAELERWREEVSQRPSIFPRAA